MERSKQVFCPYCAATAQPFQPPRTQIGNLHIKRDVKLGLRIQAECPECKRFLSRRDLEGKGFADFSVAEVRK